MEYIGIVINFLWGIHLLGAAFTFGYKMGFTSADPDFGPIDRYFLLTFWIEAFLWEIYWPVILLLEWWERIRPNHVNTPNGN